MNFKKYQEHVAKTYRGESCDRLVASLAEELGEIAQVIKKIRNQGYEPHLEQELTLELGDLIRYAVMLAVRSNISLKTILIENMAKAEAQYPKYFRASK